MLLFVIAVLPVLIWIYLSAAHGRFWQISRHLLPIAAAKNQRRVVAVIPARNEAAVIAGTLSSLFQQDFPSPVHIVLVDDASQDGTAQIAWSTAEKAGMRDRLTVIHGKPLEPGWTGKLWALSQGVAVAEALQPDYFLFTDADIHHSPDSVTRMIALAESGYDLASCMVKLACESPAEKALIPAFVFFFLMLYPPAWIDSPRFKTAGAAGGCVLIRPQALSHMGGLQVIRDQVIDDCALAQAVKRSGGKIWLGLTSSTVSSRSYGTFSEIGRMISRTAFNQLRHSTFLLVATLIGLLVTYLLPVILLFSGKPFAMVLGMAAWLLMALCYLPMVRFYDRSAIWSVCLPLVALFYMGATIHSAFQYWVGRGGEWKGRAQDVRS